MSSTMTSIDTVVLEQSTKRKNSHHETVYNIQELMARIKIQDKEIDVMKKQMFTLQNNDIDDLKKQLINIQVPNAKL